MVVGMRAPSRRACRRRFREGVLHATLSERLEDISDPAELTRLADEAWLGSDFETFVRAARALRSQGPIGAKLSFKLATALARGGLAAEALERLMEARAPRGWEFSWEFLKAHTALRLGLSGTASRALHAARELAARRDQKSEVAAVAGLIDGLAGLDSGDWSSAEAWIQLCLDGGQVALAARGFAGVLGDMAGEVPREQFGKVCEIAFAILRMGGADVAFLVLGAMEGLFRQCGQDDRLGQAVALLHGQPSHPLVRGRKAESHEAELLKACVAEALAASGRWAAAIEAFEIGVDQDNMLDENLCELARCVGAQILQARPFAFAPARPAKVFDVFPFNGEFMLLEMKLAEMAAWVDTFVLVEAAETFTGNPKPLYFAENPERLPAALRDKIVHVVVDHFPEYCRTAWAKEFFQRDAAIRALSGVCAPSDVVIISDTDEIIREEAVRNMPGPLVGADLRLFNYYLNLENLTERPPVKTVFARAQLLASMGLSYLRLGSVRYRRKMFVPDAGWHFSSVGSASEIARKFASYSHTEWAGLDELQAAQTLAQARAGEFGERYVTRDLGHDLPRFIGENRQRLSEHLL